ncbi:MAG TPA: hypothetical protein VJ327_04760 [Patescibacteria group bacterium]|nr:hypothetical protein [Patescibacteria group bacterium]
MNKRDLSLVLIFVLFLGASATLALDSLGWVSLRKPPRAGEARLAETLTASPESGQASGSSSDALALIASASLPTVTSPTVTPAPLPIKVGPEKGEDFDLFLGKPALFYTHAYKDEMLAGGITAFNPVAYRLNALTGNIEWQGLGNILKRLYPQKTNDDGSLEVRMYTNDLILINESGEPRSYHVSKEETLNVPIVNLTLNDHSFAYHVQDRMLTLDVLLPAHSSVEINIEYGNQVE